MEKKVLIIDDDLDFSRMIMEYLGSQGYTVYASDNMEHAIKVCKKEKPKVVLLDFNMPLVTGERLLPLLQNVNPEIRAIVITGCIGEEVEEKFKGLGYFAYLEKGGLSLEALKHQVEEALNY